MSIQPYVIDRPMINDSLLLDANEHCRQWVSLPEDLLADLHRYPDNTAIELRSALVAKYAQRFTTDNLLVTSGSIEAIDLLMRSRRPEKLILNVPTYDVYSHCASAYDIPIVNIPYMINGQPDVARILMEHTTYSMLVIVNPNNPSGQLVSPDLLHELIDSFTGIIVFDEAYIEYAGMHNSMEQWVLKYPNVIILRTFSKAWGLAGLRVGYIITAKSMIKDLALNKNVYSVNAVGLRAAICALEQVDGLAVQLSETLLNKEELRLRLASVGVFTSNTSANFLLIQLKDARRTHRELLQQGVITRKRKLSHNNQDCLRVTIGSPEENDAFFNVFMRVYHD